MVWIRKAQELGLDVRWGPFQPFDSVIERLHKCQLSKLDAKPFFLRKIKCMNQNCMAEYAHFCYFLIAWQWTCYITSTLNSQDHEIFKNIYEVLAQFCQVLAFSVERLGFWVANIFLQTSPQMRKANVPSSTLRHLHVLFDLGKQIKLHWFIYIFLPLEDFLQNTENRQV